MLQVDGQRPINVRICELHTASLRVSWRSRGQRGAGPHPQAGSTYLKQLKRQIPGGVSFSNRVLLIVDGHASRKSTETAAAAKTMGFDILIMPPQCTDFLQPWDQVFGSFQAALRRLTGSARTEAAGRDSSYNLTRAELSSLAGCAMHVSVGAGDDKLQRAFAKTGL
jgi:hypothetical protein